MAKTITTKKVATSVAAAANKVATGAVASAVKDVFDPHTVLLYPLASEKSIRQIEFENKLAFAVNPRATKFDVKRAVESLFKVRVAKVTLQNSFRGQKRASVRLTPQHLASDVSADLGLI